jgi:long-chain acyl-CoA synthetase
VLNLYTQLLTSAAARPVHVALIARERQLTYEQLLSEVNRFARALQSAGVRRGDAVAVLLPNCPEFTVSYYAAVAAGAVCVPANPLLKPAELVYLWNDSRAGVVVTTPALLAGVLEAQQHVASVSHVIIVGDGDGRLVDRSTPSIRTFAEVVALQPDTSALNVADASERDPAVCIYTSGTEGRPKGALLSHRNLVSNCEQVGQALSFDDRDNFLCALPLFHSFAGTVCQNTALRVGARVTIIEQFHPVRVAEAMATHGVTIFPAVPAMYGAMMQLPPDFDGAFRRVRVCVSGGAPMPIALMQAFEGRFGAIILEGDGPTECSPVTSVNPLHGVRKPGTIGVPVPGVEMKVVNEEGREVQPGAVGEIVVKGANVMLGYLNQPDATSVAMRGGWYHTGDLGTMDADGYFTIVDRKKDMLIVGGINVYPREVEEVLHRHPAVQDAAVIGGYDERRGEQVVAVITLKARTAVTSSELLRFCRERLANYKCPRKVIVRDVLPRSGTGKVLKRLLKKELELEGRA